MGVSFLVGGGATQPSESQCEVRGVFMHRSKKGLGELEIPFIIAGESELVSHAGEPMRLKTGRKRGNRLVREFDRPLLVATRLFWRCGNVPKTTHLRHSKP